MKITLEIPDYTLCAFYNYIQYKPSGLSMGVKSLNSDDLYDGAEIKVDPDNEEGVEND